MRYIHIMAAAMVVASAVPAAAQNVVTPAYVLAWEQDGVNIGTFTYETSLDSGVAAPVLGVNCTGTPTATCRGSLPQSMATGQHTIALRAVRTLDSVRYVGPYTPPITINYLADPVPGQPRNLAPILPPGAQGVVLEGIVRQRYPAFGMDVAETWLDIGAPLYYGAPLGLTVGSYSVTHGDRYVTAFWRPVNP